MSLEKKNFISQYNKGLPQILKKNLIADIETPFSSLLKISKSEKYSFLLESVEGGSKRGRYSLLGCDPDLIWTVEKGKAKIKYLDHNFDYKLDQKPIHSLKELVKISKFKNNEIDGIIVAAAGVLRLGLKKHIAEFMDEREWLPAIGQGAIGIETKKNNVVINNLVEKLNDNETSICVNTEREVSRYFQANCNTPLAALAKISGNTIQLNAMIGSLDGQQKIYFEADSSIENHKDLGIKVAKGLEAKGAKELL